MGVLRDQMIRELRLRRYAATTQRAYLSGTRVIHGCFAIRGRLVTTARPRPE